MTASTGNASLLKSMWPLTLICKLASASFLAAFTTAEEIHHIATSPLPPCQIQHASNKSLPSCSIPHVYPLTVPAPSTGIPFGRNLFCSISSLGLPSIFPSSSIPPLLRDCHRILRPSGKLYLTIIDPLPLLATTGPRLRTWLEKHLVLNLEKHFRCMNPGRLIPIWLKETRFSCQATVIEFWAIGKGEGTPAELNAIIDKMLWKEMWGGYLDGKEWWWDNEAVMEECERMETRWECSLVEAVKM
jgi:SAM-dependent methyltransferase